MAALDLTSLFDLCQLEIWRMQHNRAVLQIASKHTALPMHCILANHNHCIVFLLISLNATMVPPVCQNVGTKMILTCGAQKCYNLCSKEAVPKASA